MWINKIIKVAVFFLLTVFMNFSFAQQVEEDETYSLENEPVYGIYEYEDQTEEESGSFESVDVVSDSAPSQPLERIVDKMSEMISIVVPVFLIGFLVMVGARIFHG